MILLDQKEAVASWVLERIKDSETERFDRQWYETLGFLDKDKKLNGGVVYFNYVGHAIEAMAAGEGYWLTPRKTQMIFIYPFVYLGCRRMTVIAARRNKKSRRFIERLGFTFEGCLRKGMSDGQNAIIYGMLKEECRWIKDEFRQGQSAKAA